MFVRKIAPFRATIVVDSDKSITHRALILAAIAKGVTKIYSPSFCRDCLTTLKALRGCGVEIVQNDKFWQVLGGMKKGEFLVDSENSGTTCRLLLGLLSGKEGTKVYLTGDSSLSKRPMRRVIEPLRKMGAQLGTSDVDNVGNVCGATSKSSASESFLPITIQGAKLSGINYSLPVASAQLKSSLLIAALSAEGTTILDGKTASRNHTEILLAAMGADIKILQETKDNLMQTKFLCEKRWDTLKNTLQAECKIALSPSEILGLDIQIKGDFSSAIYFLVLALLNEDSEITIRNVNINPSRIASLDLLRSCGAKIYLSNQRTDIEQSADITAVYSKLSPFKITEEIAKHMIDELPVLAAVACFIEGDSIIEGAGELRFKESDRIKAIAEGLSKMGAKIDILPDGMIIHGTGGLEGGCSVRSFGDHRIEMSLVIAAALSRKGGEVESGYAEISFPNFYSLFDYAINCLHKKK